MLVLALALGRCADGANVVGGLEGMFVVARANQFFGHFGKNLFDVGVGDGRSSLRVVSGRPLFLDEPDSVEVRLAARA